MSKILITADIHGKIDLIENLSQRISLTEKDILIVLGDFGANFFLNKRDKQFKDALGAYKITYFIIRGNHEERPSICMENDPAAWHMEEFWGNQVYVENNYPYIKYALDYPAKYEIPTAQGNSIKTLILPGAYSVDKEYRLTNHWTWFPQEQCTKEEMDAGTTLAQSEDWDLVLSHTCPAIYQPIDLFLPFIDQSTVDRSTEQWLGNIEYNLNYNLWMFGHFHANRIYPKNNDKNVIMVFNNCVFDLYKYYCGNYKTYNSLIKIDTDTVIDNMN